MYPKKTEDVQVLLNDEGEKYVQRYIYTCNLRTLFLACIWALATVALVALFVFSVHCDDLDLQQRARHVDSTFKGFLQEVNYKPGCLINDNTVSILVMHLVGGTCIILLIAVLLSLYVCHCTKNITSTKTGSV